MSKLFFSLFFVIASSFICDDASIISDLYSLEIEHVISKEQKIVMLPETVLPVRADVETKAKWKSHIIDFLNLIDMGKVIEVVVKHIGDPDVLNFIGFVTSNELSETVLQFEDMEEFKQAVEHLQSKGYDVKSVIAYINSELESPALGTKKLPNRDGSGLTILITEIVQVLPIQDMQQLFNEKMEKHPEIRDLFLTLSSDEFIDILLRLRQNPKYLEIRKLFEGYGVDFEYLKALAKDFFGDYFKQINDKINA